MVLLSLALNVQPSLSMLLHHPMYSWTPIRFQLYLNALSAHCLSYTYITDFKAPLAQYNAGSCIRGRIIVFTASQWVEFINTFISVFLFCEDCIRRLDVTPLQAPISSIVCECSCLFGSPRCYSLSSLLKYLTTNGTFRHASQAYFL